ncbi:MAG: Acriflavin resistance protein [uncultured Sulfurovum sp.]|uniref:Acriflavin resistance protein n=1 Tax=uncultured Sulfurovum sp. TaxID=269237 RepID=A0A6S6U1F9_9BACT|nr:MAG: Acriflavin resistance protein [uncultured Sulfurovum sp.]
MDIVKFSLKNRLIIYVVTILSIAYGLIAYEKMGKLQDPEFTIKDALIITPYVGASAKEVELEVSDRIEEALQKLPYLKEIDAKSIAGQSLIKVSIKNKYRSKELPQIWDEMRKKVEAIHPYLPPRASMPIINDDFGDVYGVLFAISGEEYSYDELKDYVDFLKKELILVEGVGKIDTFGEQQRAIVIEFNQEQLSALGISKTHILQALYLKNIVSNYGKVEVGEAYISIRPEGNIHKVEDLSNIIIRGVKSNSQIALKDIATVKDTYKEPSSSMVKYDGASAITLGISTQKGGNVVAMGERLDAKLKELKLQKPLGLNINTIVHQANDVKSAINTFMINLIEAVSIVIVVLLLFMGLRSGLIIGGVLMITIIGTFIFMSAFDVMIERVSLGALIIALGMLVDNAIVVIDGILVRINRGEEHEAAASKVVKQTAFPLLAATIIAILTFAIIGTSDDMTGEYTESLFIVILISLSLSWVFAITLTPLLAIHFLKPNKSAKNKKPYDSLFYKAYGAILKWSINYKYIVALFAIAVLAFSVFNFKEVKQSFFPELDRSQIMVDCYLPQGTSIATTEKTVDALSKEIQALDGVAHISSFIGQGSLRFLLIYAPEFPNTAYAQLLIDIKDVDKADSIIKEVEKLAKQNYPNVNAIGKRFVMGTGGGKVQVKVLGNDVDKLRAYEAQILEILQNEPKAKGVRSDWGNRVKAIRPIISDEKANLNGITRDAIANAILETFGGRTIGLYREGKHLIPIIFKGTEKEREDVKNLENIMIFSPMAQKRIPLRQIVSSYETVFEDDIIHRFNRQRAISIHADPITGELATVLLSEVKHKIETIPLDKGYTLEWHGEERLSAMAQKPIIEALPLFIVMMVLIMIALFNSIKKTIIIWLVVPFSIIGVVAGLLFMDKAFGFMSLLGLLSLSGMLIKNAIVLIDEIVLENEVNEKPLNLAIYNSGINRLRAVTMAALTTALGMIPLMGDPFFSSMAVVIVFGLVVATLLTMILVPVFYAIFYGSEKLK